MPPTSPPDSGWTSYEVKAIRREDGRGLARDFVVSSLRAWRERRAFSDVERFCVFVGHPRSGHSLVGAMLNAHPDAVIAHELDVLRYVRRGFAGKQLLALVREQDERFHASGLEWTGYSYRIEGQWQGRCRRLRVAGDKKGGQTTRRLAREPHLLARLQRRVRVPVKAVHVVRNPFDNVATAAKRDGTSLETAARRYRDRAKTIERLRQRGDAEMLEMRSEDLIHDCTGALTTALSFLGLDPSDDYLQACADKVFDAPHKTRTLVDWTSQAKTMVQNCIEETPSLSSYRFDE